MSFFKKNELTPDESATRLSVQPNEPVYQPDTITEPSLLDRQDVNTRITVVSDASSFAGELDIKGSLIVYGEIEGKVRCDGEVVVAASGRIAGEILAMNLHVAGRIEGSLECGTLHILDTGKVYGQTATDTFVIDAGGFFEGQSGRRKTDNVTQLKRNAS